MADPIQIDNDLTLVPEDFTTMTDMRMPRALARLLAHLGSVFFVMDANGEFFPSAEAVEICKIIERAHHVAPEELDARTTELTKAAKMAYDVHVALIRNFMTDDDTFFKVLP